ncbi:MAG: alpha/beta fold hydrolase [Lewinellaceae bacterium]|nr:alpha/beta fold hydrolase [Lewinellaceae bacterium]
MAQVPLLLLHGALGSAAQLTPLATALNGQEVHALNFNGHGGRPLAEADFTTAGFAQDVLRFLDNHNLTTVDLFGYSMGGYVGLFLARHYPERVRRLFTLATKMHWTPEVAAKEAGMLDPDKVLEKVPLFADALRKRHAPEDWRVLLQKTAQLMVGLGNGAGLSDADFAAIACPVNISVGDADNMVSIVESERVATLILQGRLQVLPGVKHPIEKVDMEVLAPAILEFFH